MLVGQGVDSAGDLDLTRPGRGVSTLTLLAEFRNGERYVLRCLRRRSEVESLCLTHAFCRRHGVPVPDLIAKECGFWPRIRNGFHLVLEEFVPGGHFESVLWDTPRGPRVVQALARVVAGMHDIVRSGHGPVTSVVARPYLARHLKKARRKLADLIEQVTWISERDAERVASYLTHVAGEWGGSTAYSLVHGDLSGGNVLVTHDSQVVLVDLEYVHFGVPHHDIQYVRHYLFRDDAEVFRDFMNAYLSARRDPEMVRDPEVNRLFRVLVLLRVLRPDLDSGAEDKWRRNWEELMGLAHVP